MKFREGATLILLGIWAIGIGNTKPKKDTVPAVFENARYVYVQSMDGDALNPNLFPEDRQAIFDVQERLRDWKRYAITLRREDADLVFMVRRGRTAAARPQIGASRGSGQQPGNNPSQPGQNPGQGPASGSGPFGNSTQVGVRTDVGPSDDLLRVFATRPDGKLSGPIWSREQDGGLDAPAVELVRELRSEVDRAYPPTPASQQPQQQTQPSSPPQAQPQTQPTQQPQSTPTQPQF